MQRWGGGAQDCTWGELRIPSCTTGRWSETPAPHSGTRTCHSLRGSRGNLDLQRPVHRISTRPLELSARGCGRERDLGGRGSQGAVEAERAEERLLSFRPASSLGSGQSPRTPSSGPAPPRRLRPAAAPGPVIIRLREGVAASAPCIGQSWSSPRRSRHRPNNQTEKFNKQRTEGLAAAAGPERAGVRRPHLSPFTGGDRRRRAARQAERAAAR